MVTRQQCTYVVPWMVIIMPLFNRSSFRSGKKPIKRKSASLSNLSSLDESTYSVQELHLDGGKVAMKLGGHDMAFEDGQWVVSKCRNWFSSVKSPYLSPSSEFLSLSLFLSDKVPEASQHCLLSYARNIVS